MNRNPTTTGPVCLLIALVLLLMSPGSVRADKIELGQWRTLPTQNGQTATLYTNSLAVSVQLLITVCVDQKSASADVGVVSKARTHVVSVPPDTCTSVSVDVPAQGLVDVVPLGSNAIAHGVYGNISIRSSGGSTC